MMIDLGNGDSMTTEDFEKINIPVLVGLGSLDQMVKKEMPWRWWGIYRKESFDYLRGGSIHWKEWMWRSWLRPL
jgi:hypothetical protein